MSLRRELLFILILGAGSMLLGAPFFIAEKPTFYLFVDVLPGVLVWCYAWFHAWRRRELNRPDAAMALYGDLGWANRVTLLRGALIALLATLVFQSSANVPLWAPGLIYGCAAVLDLVDGWIARKSGRTTLLGRDLDTEMDALGLLVAPLLAVTLGKLHWSFLAVSAAYYLFIGGLYWRRQRQLPVFPLPPSTLRRILAGMQMGFIALILLPLFSADLTQVMGVAFMLPILVGFCFDWLAVSGRFAFQQNEHPLRNWIASFGSNYALPGLRAGAVVAGVLSLEPAWSLAFGCMVGLLICIGLGFAARTAAAVLLLLGSALGQLSAADHPILLLLCSWIALLGSGRLSFWRKDDQWIVRQN